MSFYILKSGLRFCGECWKLLVNDNTINDKKNKEQMQKLFDLRKYF